MSDIRMQVAERVKELRINKGWSQEFLANKADLDRTYLQSIEGGKRNVSIIVLKKISEAFGITLSDLLKGL